MALKKCKDCGHKVSKKAAACPECGSPLKRKPAISGCFGCFLLIVFGSIGLAIMLVNSPAPSGEVQEYELHSYAERLVGEQLRAPSSASNWSHKIVEQQGNYYLLYTEVDAQNAMGAKLRNGFLVAFRLEGGQVKYKSSFAVQAVEKRGYIPDYQKQAMKSLNKWPEPKKPESKQPEPTKPEPQPADGKTK